MGLTSLPVYLLPLIAFAVFQIFYTPASAVDPTMRAVDLSTSLRSLMHLFTKIRDRDTSPFDFRIASKRIMHMICEESIGHMDAHSVDVITPTASVYQGEVVDVSNIVGVSIIRSGDSMLDVFLNIVPTASVGKILIQRLIFINSFNFHSLHFQKVMIIYPIEMKPPESQYFTTRNCPVT
jgi:uracil phosphoribosyltransferase